MALDWLPVYPAKITAALLLGAAFQPYLASNSYQIPAVSAWKASYPDRPARKTLPVALRPSFFFPGNDYPALAVTPLAWKAVYPDRLLRRSLPPACQHFLFQTLQVPAITLSQFPRYPDRLDRQQVRAADQKFTFAALDVVTAAPLESWKPIYPSRIDKKPGLVAASQKASFFHPVPVAAPDPPGLGYATSVYPARVLPLTGRRLLAGQQQTLAFYAVPIPNLPPPTELTWQPEYPDLLYRVRTVSSTYSTLVLSAVASVDANLGWLPQYPVRTLRQPWRPAPLASRLPESIAGLLPSYQQWQPTYPDRMIAPRAVQGYIGYDPLLPSPSPALSLVDCIHWTGETVTRPDLLSEDVLRPELASEDLLSPDLDPEGSCG